MESLASALACYRRGDFASAEAACAEVLSRSTSTDALALLADIRLAAGRAADAIPILTRLVELNPREPALQRRLGGALLSTGRCAEAATVLRTAIALDPENPRAHNNLGQALMQLGEVEAAIASYETALRCDPRYAIGHSNLGLAYADQGELTLAEASLRRAIDLNPALAVAHLNLGTVLERHQRLHEALASYEQAMALSPQLRDAWAGRAAILLKLEQPAAALESYDGALARNGEDATLLAGKAFALLSLNRAADALVCADRSLAIDPASVDGHNARAGALWRLNRHAEALVCIDHALTLNPAFVQGWCNRGAIAYDIGDHGAATSSYQRALAVDPSSVLARIRLMTSRIPPIPFSPQEAAAARSAFDEELSRLETWLASTAPTLSDAFIAARQSLFYLSYREESNCSRLRRYRHATATLVSRALGAASRSAAITDADRRRFKLGFASAHVYDHSVWGALLEGWLKCLDRTRFDITVFSVGLRRDEVTLAAMGSVDRFESGARSTSDWARAIRECRLDALIYPEIGMDEITLGLASSRLAPHQLVAWGHPETSGLPTIDDYLSAEAFEPDDAQLHYTERLVTLPRLGVHVERLAVPAPTCDLDALGVARGGPIFVCPGVPFKYQPEDDHVLVEIAKRLVACTFVLFIHERSELSTKLHARLSAAFRASDLDPHRYLAFIPWQPRASFLGVLQQADVYLDTIGFSGFNTLLHAVAAGIPCVTYDGRFMRGRLGSGIVRQLGLSELIAASKAQYVELAVRLGEDRRYRTQVRERIRGAERSLYADRAAVDALSTLLLEHGTPPPRER